MTGNIKKTTKRTLWQKPFSLCIGLLCMLIAYMCLSAMTSPLRMSLVESEGKLVLRFQNTSGGKINFAPEGLEYFLLYPADDSDRYVVAVHDKRRRAVPEGAREQQEITTLAPGAFVDIGNVYPLLRGLPKGVARVEAVYSSMETTGLPDAWRGTVRSAPISVGLR